MNSNHQGDKNPQKRMDMDSQSRQASGRGSSDVSQSSQGSSRSESQQGASRSQWSQQDGSSSSRSQGSRDS